MSYGTPRPTTGSVLGAVSNATSKKQEANLIQALNLVAAYLDVKFPGVSSTHAKSWQLNEIVGDLRQTYPEVDFHYRLEKSNMLPDGGFLYIESRAESGLRYPVLISEVKNQGANDAREREGLQRQARGNAIERLGKNLIGLRTALLRESIFPFVCFGYGCDFEDGSSILDRVSTMAMFGQLNRTYLHNQEGGKFNRGSFYFREEPWSVAEMHSVMANIAARSVQYYFSKYDESHFREVSDG